MDHQDFCLTQFNPPGSCICEKVRKPYFVTMRENPTGETIRFQMRDLQWEDGSEFWWSEGNYSCDCNRLLEWREAHGEERRRDDDSDYCIGDGRFTVLKIELPDGTVVYEEES